jgi:hypothetical protein
MAEVAVVSGGRFTVQALCEVWTSLDSRSQSYLHQEYEARIKFFIFRNKVCVLFAGG